MGEEYDGSCITEVVFALIFLVGIVAVCVGAFNRYVPPLEHFEESPDYENCCTKIGMMKLPHDECSNGRARFDFYIVNGECRYR